MIVFIQIFSFVFFLIALFFLVFLPGKVVLSCLKLKISSWEEVVVSLALGIVWVTLLEFLLGWLKARFLLMPIILVLAVYIFRQKQKFFPQIKIKKLDFLGIVIISLASIFQSLLMLKSGFPFHKGLGFWGVHGYDGVWHLTLISELSRHFPPQNPGFAGVSLKNYHYFSDLFMALIARVAKIPVLDLYFRLFPIFFSFLLNSLIYFFAKKWSGKRRVGLWSVFFVSLAGSFGYIPWLLGIGSQNWETAFWGSQLASGLLNPPLFLSYIILVLGLFLLLHFKNKTNFKQLLIVGIIFGSLIEFKVYGGLICLASLGTLSFLELIFKKKNYFLKIFLLSLGVALTLFLPLFDYGQKSFFIFEPFWFIKTMISAPDRLNWVNLELRRQMYVALNYWPGLILIYFLGSMIFLIGNLGTRSIGIFCLLKNLNKKRMINAFLVLLLLFSSFPSFLFLQKGVVWNTIQFFYYFIFLFSFYAAFCFSMFLEKRSKFFKAVIITGLLFLSLPSTIKTMTWFLGQTPASYIDSQELEALNFLKKNSPLDNFVLTYPYDPVARQVLLPPIPLTYYNSAYVSFFSQRRVYLEDQNAALIQGYNLDERLRNEKEFFFGQNSGWKHQFLRENNISFIYLVDNQQIAKKEDICLEKIFDNQKAQIYKVCDKI